MLKPSQTESMSGRAFGGRCQWFRLRILHSVLLKLLSTGRRPLDHSHVVVSGQPLRFQEMKAHAVKCPRLSTKVESTWVLGSRSSVLLAQPIADRAWAADSTLGSCLLVCCHWGKASPVVQELPLLRKIKPCAHHRGASVDPGWSWIEG